MSNYRNVTFGEHLFSKIDRNTYLQSLYHDILFNYSRRIFRLREVEEKKINIEDALGFADILSKSEGTSLAEIHKTRAQEMVALLYYLYPDNEDVRYYLGEVLANTGNFLGLDRLLPEYETADTLERICMRFNKNYLVVPTSEGDRFFPAQKEIYDKLSREELSFSAPTSMGKTFMMRTLIKQRITEGAKENFAILIPTKALINEVSSELIDDLKDLLKDNDYRIVTSSGSIALEQKHNYIFVVTPERMLYILIDDPELRIDYLFVDEAHKMSSGDKRSAFYYKVIDKLKDRKYKKHIIFSAPNIPNPQVYLETISDNEEYLFDGSVVACKYAPVSQLKYIVDLYERNIRIFDSYSRKFMNFYQLSRQYTLSEIISLVGDEKHNIVYCKSKPDALQFALDYAHTLPSSNNQKLKELADSIKKDVHREYYLAEIVEKGVAYHVGYLPASIRMKLEEYYREGLIRTMFCTSTLLEGVNLPAENLFVTSFKKGYSKFDEVDFKNLIGRVGRAKYNLYGNVFVVRLQRQSDEEDLKKFEELLKEDVPPQELSVKKELNGNQKELIVKTLLKGEVEIPRSKKNQSEDNYDLMRKTMLILLDDIVSGRRSRVRREFDDYLTQEKIAKICENFSVEQKKPIEDINVSYDQILGIKELIEGGEEYPEIPPWGATAQELRDFYNKTVRFLNKLAVAFKWNIYERKTLGAGGTGNFVNLTWYAVLLSQWMQGNGLSYIISKSIENYDKEKRKVKVGYDAFEVYNGSQEHKNVIIADTLEAIEDVLLFRISSYFLRFSEEYKRQHPDKDLTNDWYEFVEYGTNNRLRIILQRSGYKRESTEYIRRHHDKFVRGTPEEPKLIKKALLECGNELVKQDTEEIQYNVPELFITEGET